MQNEASPLYENCRLCGRLCGINRNKKTGFCQSGVSMKIAWAGLHYGEEPPVSGRGGSGTLFFTGCTLGCPFCQNYQISRGGMGREISGNEFLKIARRLKEAGAENLNLVTPSHYAPSLLPLMPEVQKLGLPVVWNSSGQERIPPEIFPYIDIFLPDFKTLTPEIAQKYYHYKAYPETAAASLLTMAERRPLTYNAQGCLTKGVLLRHLVLPGELKGTRDFLAWFKDNLKDRVLLSIMSQYTPVPTPDYPRPQPARFLKKTEYLEVLEMLDDFGLEEGFIQDYVTGDDWLPDFERPNPFSSDLSLPVWHWKEGFIPAR